MSNRRDFLKSLVAVSFVPTLPAAAKAAGILPPSVSAPPMARKAILWGSVNYRPFEPLMELPMHWQEAEPGSRILARLIGGDLNFRCLQSGSYAFKVTINDVPIPIANLDHERTLQLSPGDTVRVQGIHVDFRI